MYGTSLKCPINRWMDKDDVEYNWKNWNIFQKKFQKWNIQLSTIKKGNLAICNNMGAPWGNYAKWNKSDKKRQIYDLTCGT